VGAGKVLFDIGDSLMNETRAKDSAEYILGNALCAHAPPLVRTPVNSFEFHRCRRTPQVDHLSLLLERWLCIANI